MHGGHWTIDVELRAAEAGDRGPVCPLAAGQPLFHGVVGPTDHRPLNEFALFHDELIARTAPGFARWVDEKFPPRLKARLWVIWDRVLERVGRAACFVTGE